METTYFRIFKDKNGEMDFDVIGSIKNLSMEEMNEFRSMLVVAIGTAEDMWRRAQNELPENSSKETN